MINTAMTNLLQARRSRVLHKEGRETLQGMGMES